MLPDEKVMCHETAFEKSCFDMVTKCKCRKWVRMQGKDPQTNADVDTYDCRDHIDHFLTIAVLQAQRQTTASIDAMRDEVRASSDTAMAGAIGHLNRQMMEIAAPTVEAAIPKLIGN